MALAPFDSILRLRFADRWHPGPHATLNRYILLLATKASLLYYSSFFLLVVMASSLLAMASNLIASSIF